MSSRVAGRAEWGVASPHPAASAAAAALLDEGGSAIDGAIAAAGVLAVVYPHNCSVGGDVVALIRQRDKDPVAVFGVGRSASSINIAALRDAYGDRPPLSGPLSISVPGVISGWTEMLERGGTLPLTSLLEPAIALAADGTEVSCSLARALSELDSDDPGLAQIFGPPGGRIGLGNRFVQPQLAQTLDQIANNPTDYYQGSLALKLTEGLIGQGSPLCIEDFHEHQATVQSAKKSNGGNLGHRLFTAGLPSQGFFFGPLVGAVNRLLEERRALTGRDAHLLAGLFCKFNELRDALLADPSKISSQTVAENRISEKLQAEAMRCGGERGRRPDGGVERRPAQMSGDTVAVVVHDMAGNSVSMLQSVFHSFGSKYLDPVTGVLFHNRQSMFTLKQGAPGELGPRLLPPHTLCPVMVDEGSKSVVIGTMGGKVQPQILTQVLLNLANGADLQTSVAAPRFTVGSPDLSGTHCIATIESDVPRPVLLSLEDAGFDVGIVQRLSETMGHVQALVVATGGVRSGASDPRSDGRAVCGR